MIQREPVRFVSAPEHHPVPASHLEPFDFLFVAVASSLVVLDRVDVRELLVDELYKEVPKTAWR